MRFHSEDYYGPQNFATFFEALPTLRADRAAHVCRLLDVKPPTLKNWLSGKTTPPKSAVRLLFMESFYGVSAVTTKTANELTLLKGLANSLEDRLRTALECVALLELENAALKQADASGAGFAANFERFRA